jgi:hypothetical protein
MEAAVIVPFPRKVPHPQELKEQISQLAGRGHLSFDPRIFDDRSGIRPVDIEDVRQVLINGIVEHDIRSINSAGVWNCEVIDKDEETSRWLTVSVVVNHNWLIITSVTWDGE